MNIKTKYNAGDTLYFLNESKVVQSQVRYILIKVYKPYRLPEEIKIQYEFFEGGQILKEENKCFKSLQTLKKSLIINEK